MQNSCPNHRPDICAASEAISPLLPPGDESAGFRQRASKTQAGALGVVGPLVAHDAPREPLTRAAIIQATYVLMSLSHSYVGSWHLRLDAHIG